MMRSNNTSADDSTTAAGSFLQTLLRERAFGWMDRVCCGSYSGSQLDGEMMDEYNSIVVENDAAAAAPTAWMVDDDGDGDEHYYYDIDDDDDEKQQQRQRADDDEEDDSLRSGYRHDTIGETQSLSSRRVVNNTVDREGFIYDLDEEDDLTIFKNAPHSPIASSSSCHTATTANMTDASGGGSERSSPCRSSPPGNAVLTLSPARRLYRHEQQSSTIPVVVSPKPLLNASYVMQDTRRWSEPLGDPSETTPPQRSRQQQPHGGRRRRSRNLEQLPYLTAGAGYQCD